MSFELQIARRDAAYTTDEKESSDDDHHHQQQLDPEVLDFQRKLEKVRAQKSALVNELTKLENEVKKKQTLLKTLPTDPS